MTEEIYKINGETYELKAVRKADNLFYAQVFGTSLFHPGEIVHLWSHERGVETPEQAIEIGRIQANHWQGMELAGFQDFFNLGIGDCE